MNKLHENLEKQELNKNSIDINDISTFLIQSGFLKNGPLSKTQLCILNYNNSYIQNLCELLEFNEKITINEVLKKYKKLTPSINKIFNIKCSLEEVYNQYIYFTKENIPLYIFMNWIIILDLLINNFDNSFNFEKGKTFNDLVKNKIDLIDISSIYSNDNIKKLNNKTQQLYKIMENQPVYMGKSPYIDLIITIYLLSLENKLKISKEIPNLSVILEYFELYNKIYISNINISILIYIEIILLINIHFYGNKSKKNYFEYNQSSKNNIIYKNLELSEINNISFFSPQKNSINRKKIARSASEFNNIHIVEKNLPNFYLFDNDIPLHLYDTSIKIFMFQNYLKLYAFFYLSKFKIKLTMNLTIENIQELTKKINNMNLKISEIKNIEEPPNSARQIYGSSLAPNNNFAENLQKYIKVNKKAKNEIIQENIDYNNNINNNSELFNQNKIFPNLNSNDLQAYKINLYSWKILNKNSMNLNFYNFQFNQLLIKLINTMDITTIRNINSNYIDYILNSNICYFQESIFSFSPKNLIKEKEVTDSSIMFTSRALPKPKNILLEEKKQDNINDNLSIDDFFEECENLFYFLEYYSHIDSKKLPNIIQIKFNTFKCNISQKSKNIQIFFNFSNIKEKKLFQFLKESKNMLIFIQKYQFIIRELKEFKLYQSTIRVSQTNFRSSQLNYYFNFITHKLVDYIEEIKFNKIIIYETQLNNYNHNMKVYINDDSIKKKSKVANLKSLIQSCSFFPKIKVLLEYVSDFVDIWDLIVISDSEKDIKLLRTFDDNKVFFIITKENSNVNENANKYLLTVINDKNKNIKTDKKNKIIVKTKVYEYLNIIIYTKSSQEDLSKIISVMQLLIVNKNSILDYKTNLICDRFFYERNILLDQKMQQLQINISGVIDDFFLISKQLGAINNNNLNVKSKEKKINKEIKGEENNNNTNEHFNYDFFIGDDYVGVLNNHQYDISLDSKNNYYQLIFDFLSVLSSCLELIYFILKSKNIFILRFVYIMRTKNDLYYSFEYKNSNIFIKKIKEFTSLFTLNIKKSIPIFCFISKKERETNNNGELGDDNFYDVFIRLFLNLNKVAKSNELNKEFFKKLHKNLFKDFSFELVAFSYEAFLFFNDFFINNDYLKISNGEKFEKCNILPIEGYFNYKNYMKILSLFNSKDKNSKLIVKNLNIFNFGIDYNYIYQNKSNILFGFSKIDYFISEYNNYIFNKIQYEFKQKKEALKKKFEQKLKNKDNKKTIDKFINKIKEFTFGNIDNEMENNTNEEPYHILVFNSGLESYNSIIKDYFKKKIIIRTQKNELNIFQVEEMNQENKMKNKAYNENKKDCAIF